MKERGKFVRAGVYSNIKWARDTEEGTAYQDLAKNIGGGGVCLTTKITL